MVSIHDVCSFSLLNITLKYTGFSRKHNMYAYRQIVNRSRYFSLLCVFYVESFLDMATDHIKYIYRSRLPIFVLYESLPEDAKDVFTFAFVSSMDQQVLAFIDDAKLFLLSLSFRHFYRPTSISFH